MFNAADQDAKILREQYEDVLEVSIPESSQNQHVLFECSISKVHEKQNNQQQFKLFNVFNIYSKFYEKMCKALQSSSGKFHNLIIHICYVYRESLISVLPLFYSYLYMTFIICIFYSEVLLAMFFLFRPGIFFHY
jgi:arginyl-tRNA--protein-N-Asp/Glu arginylyltransferase